MDINFFMEDCIFCKIVKGDIPASKVMDWLNTDIQQVLNVYTRTLAADVTIARAFGTSDMAEVMAK